METLLKEMIKINTVDSKNGEQIDGLIKNYLDEKGCKYNRKIFEHDGVKSYLYYYEEPLELVFCGHYDVVPAPDWNEAFDPTTTNGKVFGRGACDMKGGLVAAVEAFSELEGRIGLLVLGDEEKGGKRGSRPISKEINAKAIIFTEPVSNCGRKIKIGSRGVLEVKITLYGKGGHGARPETANNPIDMLGRYLGYLKTFDGTGDALFPNTTITPTNVFAGDGTPNIIPAEAKIIVDCRYNRIRDKEKIIEFFSKGFKLLDIKGKIETLVDCPLVYNKDERLLEISKKACKNIWGTVEVSTEGGASDAAAFVNKTPGLLEIGPRIINMHAKNEAVELKDLKDLKNILIKIAKDYLE